MTDSTKSVMEVVKLKDPQGDIREVRCPKGITAEQFDTVVRIAYWIQIVERKTPTAELIMAHRSFVRRDQQAIMTRKQLHRLMGSAAYRRAAQITGFEIDGDMPQLTEEQELAILVLTDPTIRGGLSARLKFAGVGMATFRGWLNQPLFRETYDDLGNRLLKDHETDFLTELTTQAAGGDLNAIKFAFEVSGRHNPAQQAQIDVQVMLEKVVEIIASEVKDQATLARIGTRLLALRGLNNSSINNVPPNTEREVNGNDHHQIRAD